MSEQREELPEWTRQRTPERTRDRHDAQTSQQVPEHAEIAPAGGDKHHATQEEETDGN